ncbi:hypothetical protein M2396_002739 [Pseudomonas sp. BIGb0278]|uniref:hypothetical protein n=1 Tax=Pseudomonas sp. BIGb0278 TaxID=2940607 RepID=UPI0021687876|nr:hypothetical protein [Pseudomonas sp. BIGb0278]MCS4284443.1 hypothetical protein [Pseudomonas sp. BIGb0278]
MSDEEATVVRDEHPAPAHLSDLIHAIEPVMETMVALTKAVMELSIAGRQSEDQDIKRASLKAFSCVGDALKSLNELKFEIGLLKGAPPEDEGSVDD